MVINPDTSVICVIRNFLGGLLYVHMKSTNMVLNIVEEREGKNLILIHLEKLYQGNRGKEKSKRLLFYLFDIDV